MSIPVKYCILVEAADDEEAFKKVAPIMQRNLNHGAFTVYPCDHEPPCRRMSAEEEGYLLKRLNEWENG